MLIVENHQGSRSSPDDRRRPLPPYLPYVLSVLSLAISAAALLTAASILPSADQAGFDRKVRAYLLANPQVIINAVKQESGQTKDLMGDDLTKLLAEKHDALFNDQNAPVGINATGQATMVEFFDYNCPYCRKAQPILAALERENKSLRLIYKEFPILGPGSTFAAKAALASRKQGKYLEFHRAMMTHAGAITETSVLEIAGSVGIEVDRLKADMADPAIDEVLARNLALAGDLGIKGTPTFVTPKEIIPGLVGPEVLTKALAAAGQR